MSLVVGPGLVPFSREGGYAAGKWLLQSAESPTAVFVSSDLQAVGVLRAFHEAGVKVPKEIAIVSFDGSLESEYAWPPLTVLRQPIRAMAADAVAMILERPARHEVHHVIRYGELIIRRSCGCPQERWSR